MKDLSESDIKNNLKLVSKRKKKDKTIIKIKGFEIGGNKITIMAGPCRVENEKQIMEIAKFVKEQGCNILRGGAYKPCTFPYASTGIGEKGLELLKKAGDKYGLLVVSEVMDIRLVNKVAEHVDSLINTCPTALTGAGDFFFGGILANRSNHSCSWPPEYPQIVHDAIAGSIIAIKHLGRKVRPTDFIINEDVWCEADYFAA